MAKSCHPICLFCLTTHLGPILKAQYESQKIKAATSNLADLNNNGTLFNLQRRIYHHHKQTLLSNHITNPTTPYEIALPLLLSPLTNIPKDIFTVAIQCKLCLPLLPKSLQDTPCPHYLKPLDCYGDHFFTCRYLSKKPIHNSICNAIFTIYKTLGLIAGITTSHHDTLLGTNNILLDTLLHHPANIAL
jgi:hypothetical protein